MRFPPLEFFFCKDKIFINEQVQRYTQIEALISCQCQGCINFSILFLLPTIFAAINGVIMGMIAGGVFDTWSNISRSIGCGKSSSVVVIISCVCAGFLFNVLLICFIVLRDMDYFFSAFQSHCPNISRFLTRNRFLGGGGVCGIIMYCC